MTQKPTKKAKVGFLNLFPYSLLKIGIKSVRVLSYFPRPITILTIMLIGGPFLILRAVKKAIR